MSLPIVPPIVDREEVFLVSNVRNKSSNFANMFSAGSTRQVFSFSIFPGAKDQTKDARENSSRLQKAVLGIDSVFTQKLTAEVIDGDREPIFNLLPCN